MNVTRPEADSEYSKGPAGSKGGFRAPGRLRRGAPAPLSGGLATGIMLGGAVGALLLIVAEFLPLLSVSTSLGPHPLKTISTGSHQSYALIPIGLAAGALAYSAWRTGGRLAVLALGVLGVVALLIALLGDLPDAQASGLVGNPAVRFEAAQASPDSGFYLETLGAVVLIVTAGAGFLLGAGPSSPENRSGS